MIVQDEDSNWSYRSSSRLELIPSSQIQKIQKPLTASSAVTSRSTTAQHSRATKADKKLRTILVIDSSVMSGALADDIQTVFNNYLFGDHSEQNNNAASAESQPYEFCMVNSLSVPVFRWTKYNLHLLPEDRMFDYTTIPEYEPVVLVVLESDVFLDLLCASTDGVYFPQLSDYMRRLFGDSVDSTDSMDVCEDDDVRVSNIVVLIDLDKCILKAQRKVIMCGACVCMAVFYIQCDAMLLSTVACNYPCKSYWKGCIAQAVSLCVLFLISHILCL